MRMIRWGLVLMVTVVAGMATPSWAANPSLTSYADLVERLSPAVVNVATQSEAKVVRRPLGNPFGGQNPFMGTPFEQFFEQFEQGFGERFGDFQTPPSQSLGTGVLISADGFLVTNNHVIAPDGDVADRIIVKLSNSRHEFPARVIGRDEKTDLALLKINATTALPAATLGRSSGVRVGEPVLAIGNPFGLGGTVTSGIVSALARNIGQGPYDDFIQTDAAINPGNSGGPLFNVQGEVIGINTAIFSRTGGSNGIGFAIPADTVRQVVAQLQKNGRVERGWLGVKVQTLTADLAKGLGLKDDNGALVAEVTPASPAAAAGVREGDVIIRFNNRAIDEMNDLPKLVAQVPLGTRVPLELLRNGKPLALHATIQRTPQENASAAESAPRSPATADDDANLQRTLGIVVTPLTPALRTQQQISAAVQGMVVVQARGAAAEAGLQRGDVVSEADFRPVRSAADLRTALARKPGGSVVLRVWREDGYLFVSLPVPQP
ncbi:MAG: Do family serine endopeptidase [Alphaproteobacteria bacterium]|nr:Do family serine endopeptidase [Alphaproteobacteria bacterium]